MTANKTPTGESIAEDIKHKPADGAKATDFSDVASHLAEAHAHRPGKWQEDLAAVNKAVHDKGLLPGVDIVGVRGQDLITRDGFNGKVQLVDATNVQAAGHDQSVGSSAASDIGGRHATHNPDGSGTVKAGYGDSSPWVLSQAILKSQGIDNPTPNQMANYEKELEKANHKKVSQFKPGDDIKVPAFSKGGDDTEFVGDRIETKAKNSKADVDHNYDLAAKALDKFSPSFWTGGGTFPESMSKDQLATALKKGNLTDDERKGLQFLSDNFDKLKGWNGNILQSSLSKGKTADEAAVEKQRIVDYHGSL